MFPIMPRLGQRNGANGFTNEEYAAVDKFQDDIMSWVAAQELKIQFNGYAGRK